MARPASRKQTDRTMFDPEFFPTPEPVVRQMLAPWINEDRQQITVLDPSAGSGALLKGAMDLLPYPVHAHAVEINPACRSILKDVVGIDILHDDFLTFQPSRRYDLVLMNPPFSNGAKHLLHAHHLFPDAAIVCLLNAETIRNPHTASRKALAKLIQDQGSVEFIGQAFRDSERPTDVEVALVRIEGRANEQDRFAFWDDGYFATEKLHFNMGSELLENLPAVNDIVKSMVTQHKQVADVFVEYLKAKQRLIYHAKPLIEGTHKGVPSLLEAAQKWDDNPKSIYEKFMAMLTEQAWQGIFSRTGLHNLMTAGVRKDFDDLKEKQGAMAFTEANIRALLELLFLNRATIMERAVGESFDLMTKYHPENRVHFEGWKSNDAFKVNKRVVLPYIMSWGVRSIEVDSRSRETLNDIDRGIAMVEGKRLEQVRSILTAIQEHIREKAEGPAISDYFSIRYYMKGTVHLTWRDLTLRDRFSIAAAEGKNWLPMDYQQGKSRKAA